MPFGLSDRIIDCINGLSAEDQNIVVGAWMRLYVYGESEKIEDSKLESIYKLGSAEVLRSKQNSENGAKQKRNRSESKSETQAKSKRNSSETEANPDERESFASCEGYIYINNNNNNINSESSTQSYALSCLNAFNEIMGTSYTHLPPKAADYLSRVSEEAYPVEDVRKMISYKRDEWQGNPSFAKNLNPKTLFSAEHFEVYMHQSRQEVSNDAYIDELAAQLNW